MLLFFNALHQVLMKEAFFCFFVVLDVVMVVEMIVGEIGE